MSVSSLTIGGTRRLCDWDWESHSVREFTEEAFSYAGIEIEWKGEGERALEGKNIKWTKNKLTTG